MKITIEQSGETFTWEDDSHPQDIGFTVDQLAGKIKGLLVAAGYHPESVDRVIADEHDQRWFTDQDQSEQLLNENL